MVPTHSSSAVGFNAFAVSAFRDMRLKHGKVLPGWFADIHRCDCRVGLLGERCGPGPAHTAPARLGEEP